jgi:hypothetical protein
VNNCANSHVTILQRNTTKQLVQQRPSSAAKSSRRGFCDSKRHDSLIWPVWSVMLAVFPRLPILWLSTSMSNGKYVQRL